MVTSNLSVQGNIPEILAVQTWIETQPQRECPVTEYQIDGVYARSMFIPAGTILTGKIHNSESIAILAQGTIKISNGTDSFEVSAPYIMVDKPGIKRLGVSITDVTFISIHKYNGNEPEKDLVSNTFEEYEQQLLLGDRSCPLSQLEQQ